MRKYQGSRVARNRAVVRPLLPTACFRCGDLVTEQMKWHADHMIARAEAEAMGWTEAQIDSPSNLAASHASCDARAGAELVNSRRARPRQVVSIRREVRFSDGSYEPRREATQKPSPIDSDDAA